MDPLAPLITALHNQGRLRVWSMVITVFGDLVQHRGGQISTVRLGRILGRVGVEQGALRTALSRLGRDGWVHSERVGRTSHYRLSEQGLARFAPATTRIYAPPQSEPVARWALVLKVGPNGRQEVRLCPADEIAGGVADGVDCVVAGKLQQVSQAYRKTLLSEDHHGALTALAADITALGTTHLSSPLDAVAARVLLIHRWRRIVLRFPEISPELMPADAPLTDPRLAVAGEYARLSKATEAWLGGDSAGSPAAVTVADPLPQRFRTAQQG